jgi:mannose-6-phosphate isomerase
LKDFYLKPFKLINKIQHYDWGTRNEKAFIPNLLGIDVIRDLPYSELWIGAHPKASSEILISGNKFPLNEIIGKYPTGFLGEYVTSKFGNQLPFLLKVLSAGNALSIQTHPDKEQANKLHLSDPGHYPDNNHKPEIAIAIDSLTAIAGFRPVQEIVNNLQSNPEIFEFTDNKLSDQIIAAKSVNELKGLLQDNYQRIMKKASEKESLEKIIGKIIERLSGKKNLTPEEFQFLKQHKLFGADVGLLSLFFFNIVQLKPGQAIFTDSGIPHAYIAGNIIECMANSDNVVRAGLTNKYKDVDTLLDILHYDFSEYKIINKEQVFGNVIYKTGAEEFEVAAYSKKSGFNQSLNSENKPVVILLMSGSIEIQWGKYEKQNSEIFRKGESLLIPAELNEYRLSCIDDTVFFIVRVP